MKRKVDCGRTWHHLQSIFPTLFLILLVSCQPIIPIATLALLGDLMLGRGIQPGPDALAYLASEMQAADLSLANLESPLAPSRVNRVPTDAASVEGYNLCAPSTRVDLLSTWGLDLLSLANNHQNDCAPVGSPYEYSKETASILTAAGISSIGPGPQPIFREMHGLKLTFLAFDDVLTHLDGSAACRAIRTYQARGDLVVVLVHWGMEYQSGASERQVDLAKRFAESGAALVVGTHPHVIQPATWIPTARGATLILYSLGNALFDQAGLSDTRHSVLVVVTLNTSGVKSVRAIPFEIDVTRSLIFQPDAQTTQQIHKRINLP